LNAIAAGALADFFKNKRRCGMTDCCGQDRCEEENKYFYHGGIDLFIKVDGFSALQIIFLFFLQENDPRKALIPFIGVNAISIPCSQGVCVFLHVEE
jgi:hypothetical protein